MKRSNGEGSVYWLAARSRYMCQAYPPGAEKPVYKTVPKLNEQNEANDRAAIRYLNKWLPTIAKRAKKQARVMMRDYLVSWLDRSRYGSPNTYRNRRSAINMDLMPQLGDLAVDAMTPDDLRKMYAAALKRGLKPVSVDRLASITTLVFQSAVRDGLIAESPALAARPVFAPEPPREYPVIGLEQLHLFRRSIANHWLETMFIVAMDTGLRNSELRGLRWVDLNLTDGILSLSGKAELLLDNTIRRGPTKNRRSRAIALSDTAIDALRQERLRYQIVRAAASKDWVENDLVWSDDRGGFLRDKTPLNALHACLDSVGLPRMRLHDLRHTFAIALLEETGSTALVADALGHSDTRVTERVYARVTMRLRKEVAAAMNRRAKVAFSETVTDSVTDSTQAAVRNEG